MGIDKGIESGEFILLMHRLQEDVGISIGVQVVEGIDMNTEKTFGRVVSGNKVDFRITGRAAEKRGSGTIGSYTAELSASFI